jgi:VIT1/CCC1 family predicted Fe2+/Mn2+ transporter
MAIIREEQPSASAAGLLGRLIEDVTALLRNEVALARAEAMETGKRAMAGVGDIAVGGGVLLAGALALVAAVVLGLAEFMAAWLAALIVGVVLAAMGYGMVKAGRRRLAPENLEPKRTARSLRKDKETITQSHAERT